MAKQIECPTLACHSERSAAESKNLLLDPLRIGWDTSAPNRRIVPREAANG